jgi:hypothetical protein
VRDVPVGVRRPTHDADGGDRHPDRDERPPTCPTVYTTVYPAVVLAVCPTTCHEFITNNRIDVRSLSTVARAPSCAAKGNAKTSRRSHSPITAQDCTSTARADE